MAKDYAEAEAQASRGFIWQNATEYNKDDKVVGNTVYFGRYEQDNNTANGKERIQWRILARDGNYALLLAEYSLDAQPYNTVSKDVTWETCTLRA